MSFLFFAQIIIEIVLINTNSPQLYRERFIKLGYSTTSILNALQYLRMLLNETHLSNQHVEIVRMFLDSEFFITELTVLAYFTHCVSLPLLNFVEVNSQHRLFEIFLKLFQDLKKGKMGTLSDYLVVYKHVSIEPPTSETNHLLLKAMCEGASKSLLLQCGREYGFGQEIDAPVHATQMHLLSKEDLTDLPTNNIPSEHVLCF